MSEFMDDFSSDNDNYLNFSMAVEKYAVDNESTLSEALLDFMETYDIDFSDINKLVSKQLKDRLSVEHSINTELTANALF
jgi:outer membrane scaffolding protein for murein synthesis (MipA/OmpV family)